MINYNGLYNLIKEKDRLEDVKNYTGWDTKLELKTFLFSPYGSLPLWDIRVIGEMLGVTFHLVYNNVAYNLNRCDLCDIIISIKELNGYSWGFFSLSSYSSNKVLKHFVTDSMHTIQELEYLLWTGGAILMYSENENPKRLQDL